MVWACGDGAAASAGARPIPACAICGGCRRRCFWCSWPSASRRRRRTELAGDGLPVRLGAGGGLAGAAAGVALALVSPSARRRCWALACVLGSTTTVLMHHTDWMQPLLVRLSGPATPDQPMPLRRFDPTCRLRGWPLSGRDGGPRCASRLRTENDEPVLAASSWSLPGELGVYCAGHPQAYSLGLAMGDRHSQYDFWPNPLDDVEAFRGRTFIVVGWVPDGSDERFRPRGGAAEVVYTEKGRPIAAWTITVCHGYRGFAKLSDGVKKF